MQTFENLDYGKFYHVYNHGVANRDLFQEIDNYPYFMNLFDKYISVVADTYAWVLMKNHFHFLVRIKEEDEIRKIEGIHLTGFENLSGVKPPHQYFSNLFNAYSRAYNKRYHLRGALFERPFKRKCINDEKYLKNMVLYIHQNPVHHGFCQHLNDYLWSSYPACISSKPTKIKRDEVISWFDGEVNFKYMHHTNVNADEINSWLEN